MSFRCLWQAAIADCLDLDDLNEVSADHSLPDSNRQQKSGADSVAGADTGGRVFAYPCRCGSSYTLHEADLTDAADSIVVGCAGCSLHVRVTYSVS